MSTEPTTHDDEDDELEGSGTAPGSVLDLIEQTREDLAAEGEPLLVPLVAYGERVALRFDYPEGGFAQIRRALGGQRPGQRRVKNDDEAELKAIAAVMVTCCTGVVEVKAGLPEDQWPSIDPRGRDLRINRTLAELLKVDVPNDLRKPGEFILRHLYSPRAHATGKFNGDPALLADGTEVQAWLDAGGVRADEQLPGE